MDLVVSGGDGAHVRRRGSDGRTRHVGRVGHGREDAGAVLIHRVGISSSAATSTSKSPSQPEASSTAMQIQYEFPLA